MLGRLLQLVAGPATQVGDVGTNVLLDQLMCGGGGDQKLRRLGGAAHLGEVDGFEDLVHDIAKDGTAQRVVFLSGTGHLVLP